MTDKYRIDGEKISLHPHRVVQWLDNKDEWETAKSIYPIYVEVSPIGGCNHSCSFCAVDTILEANKIAKNIPKLDEEIMKSRLSEMASLGVKSIMMAGAGESLLNKAVPSMAEHAYKVGIDVAFTTNLTIFKQDIVRHSTWIKVSLNAGTRESYAKIHDTKEKDWDKVWGNITEAVAFRNENNLPCSIGVQCVLLPENSNDMIALAKRCRDYGVDYLVIKPYSQGLFSINTMVIDYSKYGALEKELEALNTKHFHVVFRASSMKAVSESIPYTKCMATSFFWAYIAENGDVSACSAHLNDERFMIGNINQNTFKEIWEGEKRRECFEMMKNFNIATCRKSCRMNSVNMYLNDVVNGADHRNFI